jgi:hypothetical protein
MLAKLRPRSAYDVMAALALFLALTTASAYAANTIFSSDIVDGEVKTPDLANEAVSGPKLKPGAVGTDRLAGGAVTTDKVKDNNLGGRDVLDNSLKGADIDESTLTNIGGGGPAGGDLTGTYPNPQIAPNAVGGNEVDESTLGQVPSALLGGFGRSGATTFCNPESSTFVPCAATEILNVPPGARALVFGRAEGAGQISGPDFGWGLCFLSTSSTGEIPNTRMEFLAAGNEDHELATLVGVTPPLPAGPTSFGINCNQLDPGDGGTISYEDISASAVLIAGN